MHEYVYIIINAVKLNLHVQINIHKALGLRVIRSSMSLFVRALALEQINAKKCVMRLKFRNFKVRNNTIYEYTQLPDIIKKWQKVISHVRDSQNSYRRSASPKALNEFGSILDWRSAQSK